MKQKRIAVVLGVLIAGLLGGWFFYERQAGTDVDTRTFLEKDPFENFRIPDDIGPAERAILEEKIAKTKAMYEENKEAWEAWIAIGNMRALVNDYEGAIQAYRNSLVLQSNNVLGYRNIAEVYRNNLNDNDKAVEYYKLAIENSFGDIELYIALAQIQEFRLNDSKAAEETLMKGVNTVGADADLLIRLIRLYERQENVGKAKETAERLLLTYPDNEEYAREWGKYRSENGT